MRRKDFLKNSGLLLGSVILSRNLKAGVMPISGTSAAETHTFEAETAELIGGASRIADNEVSGGYLVSLAHPGQGITFTGLPAAGKLAIRYASVTNGTISVAVNGQSARKVNVHSSGALTNCVLHSVIEVAIPTGATLTISLEANDVPENIDKIIVGDGDLGLSPDIWNLSPLQVEQGPYSPDWKEISRRYVAPEWWRDAKFGAWSHWDPQSMPEDGDWYARGMYIEDNPQYKYNLKHFGHPSIYGYKDICHNWVIDRWNPDEMMDLYVEMGARYFMAMGCHHDNFDCFDSKYQPWNSVNVGPKTDIVGTWEKVARRHGLHFGIGFHDTPGRTWGQFMPVRYTSDKNGPMKGVPYDAMQTILDGKGKWSRREIAALAKPAILQTIMDGKNKWWKGRDPVDLYGPPHTMDLNQPRSLPGNDPLHSPFANQFMWRVDDAISRYHPDVIYFDDHAGDSQVDLGVHMGLGFLAPQIAANYYNKSLQWNHGKMDVVLNLKGVGGRYNSFQDHPELLPFVDRSLVKSTEAIIEPKIMAYPFQTETTCGVWHYKKGQHYLDAKDIIQKLMENVSRNGSLLLNISQHGRGNLDPEAIQICKDVGAWLKVNGEAVYGSRPFEVSEENANAVCYTRNSGNVYAVLLNWNGGPVTLESLRSGGATLGKVSRVELLGSDVRLTFVQDDQGLTVKPGAPVQPLSGIDNQQLATQSRVLRIAHDKGWINDDDPGATYPGWIRRCNLGTGDFNNDLTISNTPGDVWSCPFTGSSVSVIAPMEKEAGKIEVQIDRQTRATADLSTSGRRLSQQPVCEVTGLKPGKHSIAIINRGPGPVAVDALVVR